MIKDYDFKEKLILLGWITALLLLISLIFISSNGLQRKQLMRTVNNVFYYRDDSRRVTEYTLKNTVKSGIMGYWFSINNSTDKIFVFTVFQDGILLPLGAVVSHNGEVREIIPMSEHALSVFKNIPDNILQIYIKKIEMN
ncbi:MAG: hypothetical protein FWC19_02285 [Treponema sp.]|nr:hypothetical protein [Treponema sp.]